VTRVAFFWTQWVPPVLTEANRAQLGSELAHNGIRTTAKGLIKTKYGIPGLAICFISLPVILDFCDFFHNHSPFALAVQKVSIVLFAWGALQLPIWIIATIVNYYNCTKWLKSIYPPSK
jgi:hypothetical protein